MPPIRLPFSQLQSGLAVLLEALDWSSAPGIESSDFAVEIRRLHEAGLSDTHLRWLISGGYLQHAFEFTLAGDEKRSFRRLNTLKFRKCSCFMLTPAGADFARPLCEKGAEVTPATDSFAVVAPMKPHWDRELRQLTVGEEVIKRFHRPAKVQELILASLEEEHWPRRIDDPVPHVAGQDPKRRLRGVIESLNSNQIAPRIHFFGDGTGEGVCWTFVPS